MSYFAVAAGREGDEWNAAEVDLDEVADVEDAAEVMREAFPDADLTLLFVDADDEFLTMMRLDDGDDLRTFGSDAEYASQSRLGEALLGDLEPQDTDEIDTDDEESISASPTELDAEPVGEADLLSDLGVGGAMLLALCAKEGMMPSDVVSEVAAVIGFAEALENATGA
ncbi:tRNA adenosine deaminase-associated protein [Glycomyces xiaoerkulensis]|uniref:tRNA adenosine deaminase-associated protein n=1 Tax=Glycomyces xiaoerkulensis TaxID=2038139 RepID=UPI000C25E747|nr:tRNA adenosine deaminase-associated protein [Glycomyces xiaoerkulensis]